MLRTIKIGLWVLLSFIGLLVVMTVLLYVPPVQDFVQQQVVRLVAEHTNLQVAVERVELHFPLNLQVRGVLVTDTTHKENRPDTLLYVRQMRIGVQIRPLLHGQVNVDGIGLKDVQLNTVGLLENMHVEGRLEHFFVSAHGIDLKQQHAVLNRIELQNVRMKVALMDSLESSSSDSVSVLPRWTMELKELRMRNVAADVQFPGDSISLKSQLAELRLEQAEADLGKQCYAWRTFRLEGASLDYGLVLRDVHVGLDSVFWQGKTFRADLTDLGLNEGSGLSVTALTGHLRADSTEGVRIPNLRLLTPHSEINLQTDARSELIENPERGCLNARLDARIGKEDILLLTGKNLPEAFRRDYPFHPLHLRVETVGNLAQMNLTRFQAELPGAFTLEGRGELHHLIDTLHRDLRMNLRMRTGSLDFLKSVANLQPETKMAIPDSMLLEADLGLQGEVLSARIKMEENSGKLEADAQYHFITEAYEAKLTVDSLDLHHFLPSDSLRHLTLRAEARGLGTDFSSPQTRLRAQLQLDALRWGAESLRNVGLTAQAGDSIGLTLRAGDLRMDFHARETVDRLLKRSIRLTEILTDQLEDRALNHAALRRALPSAGLYMQAGPKNPLSNRLRRNGICFDQFKLDFSLTPGRGINGRTNLLGLWTDSLRLDTLFFAIHQDSARMRLQGGIVNGPENPRFVCRATLTGEMRSQDAELTLKYVDGEGNIGILLGVNARPLIEGYGRGNGLLLNLLPEQPIIAYRRFNFANRANWVYLHRDGHVYASVDMRSDDGIGLRMMSDLADTASLQNIQIALTRFRLSELSRIMPYLPQLKGLLSVEGHYLQTREALQVTGRSDIKELTYEKQTVGDIGANVSWLPREGGKHYLNAALTLDSMEVVNLKGILDTEIREGETPMNLRATIQRLPLQVANAFIPDGMARLAGQVNGEFHLMGTAEKPLTAGSLTLDSTSVYISALGARYDLSNRPIRLEDGRLKLDAFSIYTTGTNPFTIDGEVNLAAPQGPLADLRLHADAYTLLDAKRTRGSLVYGKVITNLNATVKGPIDALSVRGSMHLLGSTNLTYVLTDSPLTVDDRLSGLVTFVSFADTVSGASVRRLTQSPGGIDLLMAVRIDDAVRLRADLSPDRSKYIELEGGGDLSLRYTPQGDMSLTGRYTLSDGLLKYSLPVIPLKEFHISRGSYVDWKGDVMNPTLDLTAIEQTRASVADGDNGATRMVDFDVSISIKGGLSSPQLQFDIAAPHDATVQNELITMGADERGKQAIAMLATGVYLNSGVKGGGLNMGAALNTVLQSQINSLAGQVKGASISVGVEDRTSAETGEEQTDYSFRYAQRFFNDRVQIVIGGKVSTGAGATNSVESFIDNISLEYRLDASGTRYIRVFYNKNYESVLDGEITETGIGLVLRRKVDRLSELFIFRKKKEEEEILK